MGIGKKDILGFEKFALDEMAINTISTMMGFTSTDIFYEEKKDTPDMAKIEGLKSTLRLMSTERQEIYGGNDEIKRSVIERYSPIIRERVEKAERLDG
jgi:hypothetical protein